MPRRNRSNINTSFIHLMVQGINREYIFKYSEYKEMYIKLLNKLKKDLNIKVLVYVIMENHAHMLIYYERIEDVSKLMNKVNTSFARYYNTKENRVGYVFRDRYKTQAIKDRQHLYNTIAYIHNNPVKAGIVNKCSEYKFSSYNDFINNTIDKENIKILFGSYNYYDVFEYIHKHYLEDDILEEKNCYDVELTLQKFMKENNLKSIKELKRDNTKLISIIHILRKQCNLSDRKIVELLNIGKNRIYILVNKQNKKG